MSMMLQKVSSGRSRSKSCPENVRILVISPLSYLLIIDANRDMQFAKSAKVYNKIARQVVHGHGEFIRVSQVSDPDSYKFELE